MRSGARFWATSSFLMLLGCSDSAAERPTATEPWFVQDPLGELPAKLSAVGIYQKRNVSNALEPAIAYEPGFPLWSDGGKKFRSLVLPPDTSVDSTDADAYVFPVGTLIFKTFAFKTARSPADEVPVETRLLRLKDGGWEFSAYAWNDEATDAELLDLKRSVGVEVLSDDGEVVEHAIPSRLECKQCHESAQSEVLGISELQLAKSGSLSDVLTRLDPAPAKPYRALPEHGPLTTDVLGYFTGNCMHCHNGSNGAASSFDLRPNVALQNIVNQPTESSATADGLRISPGSPDESILYLGVKGGTELEVKDMPPVGVALRDAGAVQLLADWILALGNEDDP